MTNPIEGAFLRMSPEQAEIIYSACREEGLPESGEGILSLLMLYLLDDAAEDEEPPPIAEKVRAHFEKNPQDLAILQGLVGNIGNAAINLLKRKFTK